MKLERFFSMLAPTGLNFACFSLRKAMIEAFLHMLGLQVYFLFVPSLLPTVMDPSSVIIRVFFFFLFVPFTIHLVIVMQIWISARGVWILDSYFFRSHFSV